MDESNMDDGVTNLEDHREPHRSNSEVDIRRRSPEKRQAHMRDPGSNIRRLSCFPEVDKMVREGKFLREIVDTIHARGELLEVSRDAVRFMVRDYRDYIYSDNGVVDGDAKSTEIKDDDDMYALHSMEKHLKSMEDRIAQEVEIEKRLSKLFSTTHKEYLTLLNFAKEVLKQRGKMGLLNRERGGVRQRVGSGTPGRIDVAEVIANPKSRQKIMGFVEAWIQDPDLFNHMPDDEPKQPKTSRPKRKKRQRHDS